MAMTKRKLESTTKICVWVNLATTTEIGPNEISHGGRFMERFDQICPVLQNSPYSSVMLLEDRAFITLPLCAYLLHLLL